MDSLLYRVQRVVFFFLILGCFNAVSVLGQTETITQGGHHLGIQSMTLAHIPTLAIASKSRLFPQPLPPTARPPTNEDGGSCTQSCMKLAAGGIGCNSMANKGCICARLTDYLSTAERMMGRRGCQAKDIKMALNDARSLCSRAIREPGFEISEMMVGRHGKLRRQGQGRDGDA